MSDVRVPEDLELELLDPVEAEAEAAMDPVVWQGMALEAIHWLETTLLSDMKSLVTARHRVKGWAEEMVNDSTSIWGITERNPNPIQDYNAHHAELKAKRAALEIMCWAVHPTLGVDAQKLFNEWWKSLEERAGLEWRSNWN